MVAFNNPELLRLAFQPQVYVSGPNQAPVLDTLGSFEVMPGRTLEIPLNATDPDGDRVTFSLRSDTNLPMGELDGTSKLVFTPRPDQVGEYTFTLVATDGAEEVTQTVTLNVVADPDTTTRISGRVLDTLGNALANTRISLGAAETFTDTDGYFTIIPVDGADALKIFGNEYTGSPGEEFPFVAEKLPLVLGHDLYAGVDNVIDRPIYLPALDLADNSQTTDAAGNITVTNDVLKAEVLVAANSLIDPQGNPFTGTLSISDVPPDLTPAALPTNLSPDLVVTIQPGDMEFTEPAQLTLPNQAGWASGAEMDLWSINPTTGEFETVGRGRVSADGSVIETIEGGIRNSSWHFFVPPKVPYTARKEEQGCETCETKGGFSSDVSLNTGAVTETHTLATYQSLGESRGVQLVYDSLRADPRPIVQFSYDNLDINSLIPVRLQNNSRLVASLSIVGNGIRYQVPGYQGDLIGLDEGAHFWRLPESADPVAGALQADLRDFASGVYQYSLSSGIYTQPRSDRFVGRSTNNTGELVHVNTVDSAWGSGWGVAGVQELIETRDGSVLLIDGDGTELLFKIDSNGVYQAPPGDFSSLERLSDGTFRRTDK
ncbi:MAG: Ig-like domain-containing protein, partial [Pseudanabaenales cyanobacterium]|nr:Ig-like domain-containing protein [Pseudanabaenales cyanobacterium]